MPVKSTPLRRMRPERAGRSPTSVFSSVVLPMPLRPMIATASRSPAPIDTSWITCDSRYATLRLETSSMRGSSVPEIDVDHTRVVLHLGDRAFAQQLSLVQHGHLVRDAFHEVHV